MKCNEFCNRIRAQIGKFNESMNNNFPELEMSEEEWENQLLAWFETYMIMNEQQSKETEHGGN